jgi:hypothetical protein
MRIVGIVHAPFSIANFFGNTVTWFNVLMRTLPPGATPPLQPVDESLLIVVLSSGVGRIHL